MSLLHCDMELEGYGRGHEQTQAYKISMTAILAAFVIAITPFSVLLPLPLGIVILYIFRDLGNIAGRVINIKNLLSIMFILTVYADPYLLLSNFLSAIIDGITIMVVMKKGFIFDSRAVFSIGAIVGIIVSLITLVILLSIPQFLNIILFTLESNITRLPTIFLYIMFMLLINVILSVGVGCFYLISFKFLRTLLENSTKFRDLNGTTVM